MRQGEIWYSDLNPTKRSEQSGMRPVVILSGDLLNTNLGVVICIPLTTKVKNYKGNPILSPGERNGLTAQSEMLMFHVRSISKERLVRKVGTIEKSEIQLAIKTMNELLKY
jgi:mRNA interferase MazF